MKERFIERLRNWCIEDLNTAIKKIAKLNGRNKDGWELDTSFFKTPGE